MRDWKPWDWIAYLALGLSTLILALREAHDRVASIGSLAFVEEPIFGFAPLALFVFATLILICRAMGWIGPNQPSREQKQGDAAAQSVPAPSSESASDSKIDPLDDVGSTRGDSRSEYVPLHEAATDLYTLARERGTLLGGAAERLSGDGMSPGTPDQVLNYVAAYMCQTHHVRVYGRREPSYKVELISNADVKRGVFIDGAMRLKDSMFSGAALYTELRVKRAEYEEIMAHERSQDRVPS